MRTSKSRSRSKSNRNRSVGNIVNRVFDSSGPEGKVRGTPQQIIDKYLQLARDATLSNDRVATENFQQHAEHYTRMLGEAQREAEARRDAQESQNRDRQRERDEARGSDGQDGDEQPVVNDVDTSGNDRPTEKAAQENGRAAEPAEASDGSSLEVVGEGNSSEGESGLVETPEDAPAKPRRRRKPRAKPAENAESADAAAAPKAEDNGDGGSDEQQTQAAE